MNEIQVLPSVGSNNDLNTLLSTQLNVNTSWVLPWTFGATFYGVNDFQATANSSVKWSTSSSDPTASVGGRLILWDPGGPVWTFDNGNIRQFGDIRFGKSYSQRPVSGTQGGTHNVSATDEHNTVFTNLQASSETDFQLPAAAAGDVFTFYVNAAQIVKIIAAGSDTIAVNGAVSAGGGHTSCAVNGCSITLQGIAGNGMGWIATSVVGVWTTT